MIILIATISFQGPSITFPFAWTIEKKVNRHSLLYSSRFLNFSTIDILSQRLFPQSGLFCALQNVGWHPWSLPAHASSAPLPSHDNRNCLQTWSNVSCRTKPPPAENHSSHQKESKTDQPKLNAVTFQQRLLCYHFLQLVRTSRKKKRMTRKWWFSDHRPWHIIGRRKGEHSFYSPCNCGDAKGLF